MFPRGTHEISRLEAFSDAVFAFALTLLVVSLEVPKSYAELTVLMSGFLAFGCCFALLVWIWYEHNLFFRRYGLQDGIAVVLNGALLFVVMFYVYPLKFMFNSWFARFLPFPAHSVTPMTMVEFARSSALYAIGFVLVFTMFCLLYLHAYRNRQRLKLSPREVFDIQAFAYAHLVSVAVGCVAFFVALFVPARYAFLSPMSFCLMTPAHLAFAAFRNRMRRAMTPSERR